MKTALNLLRANSLWRFFTIGVIIAFSFILFGNVSPTQAYDETGTSKTETFSNTYNSESDIPGYNTAPNVELDHHNAIQVLVIDILSAVSCQVSGIDPSSENGKCIGVDPITEKIGFVEGGGAIAGMAKLIDYTFVPPTSSVQYIAYLKNNFGLAKTAHAAEESDCLKNTSGVGFCGLLPLLPIWEAMRNIVYLLLILIFVIIGMGIMLRLHIDPRTVMTIQNQIPKIIVGILAITFSFAIAGFLIDIMWVAIYLFASVLASTGGFLVSTDPAITNNTEMLLSVTQATDPFAAVNAAYGNFGIIGMSFQVASTFAELIKTALQPAFGDLLTNILGGFITTLGMIIVFFAILILLFRLWVSLILAYVYIILDVIFAPFFILAGLVPGSSLGLGAWLRDLIANLATFPMAISFILLGSYLMKVVSDTSEGAVLSPPLIGGTNPQSVAVLIGFGFLLMLPNMLSTMKAALKAPKMNFGPMFGPVGSAGKGVAGQPKKLYEMKERYQYNRRGEGMGRWKSLVGNPLLRPTPPEKLTPSHRSGTPGSGAGH